VSETLTVPLFPRRLVAGPAFGAMRSRTRGGAGLDLVGSRAYRFGDDIRRIDWHASARVSALRGNDEFVVREYLTDEATHVLVALDRGPSMTISRGGLPWLEKAQAAAEAATLIRDSALAAACVCTDLEYETGDSRQLAEALLGLESVPPPGTMVFALSDFLTPLDDHWHAISARGWDVVPVVIQDPLWERSFPDVGGALLPLADPATGRARATRLTAGEVAARRQENEARFAELMEAFHALDLDVIVVSSSDRGHVYEAFVDWANGRHQGARVAR
jgi:uncharacterized protein (DUF58 family)